MSVTPHLPADWDNATVKDIPFGTTNFDVSLSLSDSQLVVEAVGAPTDLHLDSLISGARVEGQKIRIPLPPVEIAIIHQQPEVGAQTRQLKVLDERSGARHCDLSLEGLGGMTYTFLL